MARAPRQGQMPQAALPLPRLWHHAGSSNKPKGPAAEILAVRSTQRLCLVGNTATSLHGPPAGSGLLIFCWAAGWFQEAPSHFHTTLHS